MGDLLRSPLLFKYTKYKTRNLAQIFYEFYLALFAFECRTLKFFGKPDKCCVECL